MEKRRRLMKQVAGTVMRQQVLGSWRLPSGNQVQGVLFHAPKFYGVHMEIGTEYPLTPADLYAYADFIVPEARNRVTALVGTPKRGKVGRAKRGRTCQR
jgi:hypothetical protein